MTRWVAEPLGRNHPPSLRLPQYGNLNKGVTTGRWQPAQAHGKDSPSRLFNQPIPSVRTTSFVPSTKTLREPLESQAQNLAVTCHHAPTVRDAYRRIRCLVWRFVRHFFSLALPYQKLVACSFFRPTFVLLQVGQPDDTNPALQSLIEK